MHLIDVIWLIAHDQHKMLEIRHICSNSSGLKDV